MRTEGVDPRDVVWEIEEPTYRVYFWGKGTASDDVPPEEVGYYSDEHRVRDATDVREVIGWAERTTRPNESYTLYVERDEGGRTGLIQLAGIDPTR